MNGGLSGSTNYVEVVKADGDTTRYASCTALTLEEGDVVKVYTATGGGYGDPKNRTKEQILDDIRNGYLTPARASEVYGVSAG